MRDRSEFMLLWPLSILALTAMVLLGVSLGVGSRQVDARVRLHEQQLIGRGIEGQVKEVENAVAAQTVWDAAVVNLDNRFNDAWAHEHLPAYLHTTIGVWDYLVVDGQDRPVWASHDLETIPVQAWSRSSPDPAPIIAEIRDLERRRGPLIRPAARSAAMISKPITITRIEARGGRAYMWTASLVQPDFGAALPRGATSAILVAGGYITLQNLAGLQARYGLADAHIAIGARAIRPGEAATQFATIASSQPVFLVWTPERPSHDLLLGSAWLIAGAILLFLALGVLMFRRTQKAAHDLFETNRTQTEFLANMSHEIRTPLNGVTALAEVLARTDLNPSQKTMVETIRSSGVLLERLLSDILDLARIDAKGMSLEHATFNLAAAVREVVSLMESRARSRGLELRLNLDPATDATVTGDVTRLKQVLTNLISNAIKFTDAGHVELTVRRPADGLWRFDVKDTGIGFDPAMKARLFQRFQQADGSVTRRFGGTGLGLAISRELALKMGGTLEAEGAPGRGAVFTLRLPLPAASQPEADLADPQPPSAAAAFDDKGLRVLISEDNPVNRMVIEMLMESIGADVLSTENGQEACDAFEHRAFDLILMDMQMPVMDGLTAIRRIREREQALQLPRTPIVMVTANALPEHRAASLEAGADLFVTKPVDGARLFEAIRQLRHPMAA